LDEAIAHYAKAVELKPDYVEANTHLGNCLFQKGRLDEAITHYQKALQIKPDYAPAHNSLGNALMREGKVDEAITHYRKALQLDPVNPSFQSNLAWLLATSPRASLRNGNIAVELARRANELTGGTNPLILRALAAAFAEAGRFPEAVETAQRGWQLAQAQSNTKVAGQLQSDIKLYEAGSPYHLPAQPH
jgi:Flp pilus assembly protein TadD